MAKRVSVTDAGRKGGSTTKARYGVEHFRELSRKAHEAKRLIREAGIKALAEQAQQAGEA